MFIRLLSLLWSIGITGGRHFDGGTITWAPVDPYDNSTSVGITITQSYAWSYPTITCATNVPISTSGRSSWNLTCVVDCSTDGGYSAKPIDILTDCTSVSSSLGMMNSQRSHNLTLTAGAHFYLANVGSAWVALNNPSQSGLQWSIVTFIDLRMRPDGFINTPPVASVVSPQYAIVNRTVQINIPVSDVNTGDDVRCRWSTYTAGYRRRKRSDKKVYINQKLNEDRNILHSRKKRATCTSSCQSPCLCTDPACIGTNCGPTQCNIWAIFGGCQPTTAPSTTTVATTTLETQGTLKSTSSYAHRQALDECGDICYPGHLPSGTTLSNCTVSFTGLQAGIWYAVAIQVEDFINTTSLTPMSSVPVQLLIYVMPEPTCSTAPVIIPLNRCLEIQAGVTISFDLYAMNLCVPTVAQLADMIVSTSINGMINSNLTNSSTNSSLAYLHFTWTPQSNQIGSQQLCTVAYTDEQVQSAQYCVTFTVKATSDLCVTTTTTSTSTSSETTSTTTTESTTTTSDTTTTTSSTTTSETTSTTSETTTTSTTSTSTTTSTTTSSTSSSSTSTSTTSTSTSTTTSSTSSSSTSSTSTTSTTTSTTSTSTSTTTSSTSSSSTSSTSTTSTTTSTTSTSTSTTTTSVTTTTSTSTTATTATTTTVTTTTAAKPPINWPLIVGLSLLALLLALCCCCYCLYRFCWSPAARRHCRKNSEVDIGEQAFESRVRIDKAQKTRVASRLFGTHPANKNHDGYNIFRAPNSAKSSLPSVAHKNSSEIMPSEAMDIPRDLEENRSTSTVSVKRIKYINIDKTNNPEDIRIKSSNECIDNRTASSIPYSGMTSVRVDKKSKLDLLNENQTNNSNIIHQEASNAEALPRSNTGRITVAKVSRNKTAATHRSGRSNIRSGTIFNPANPTLEMQPIPNHSKTASHVIDSRTKSTYGVTVTKLPRIPSTTRSHHS